MTNDYEKFCASTDVSNQSLQFYLDGMNEENGEISGIFKRIRRGDYGKRAMSEVEDPDKGLAYVVNNYSEVKMDLIKEIGDRHWYTTRFLQKLNMSWKLVEQINMDKLKERVDKGTLLGKGDKR